MPDLGGQFVCSFKSNLKGFELLETYLAVSLWTQYSYLPIFRSYLVRCNLVSTIAASCKYYRCAL